jgi:putative hydrolase of the HAD superfamily
MTAFAVKRLIFDADDTLWENNIHFIKAAEDLVHLLVDAGQPKDELQREFQLLEKKVVKEKGYGSGNYLYILKTLFNLYIPADHAISLFNQFKEICDEFESHLIYPPRVFPGVPLILKKLAARYRLYVLTKGNISEQEQKLQKSGLMPYFKEAFVETEKDITTYRRILREKKWPASDVCMIGNSPKSDINPALQLGMCAIFIPYPHTWVLDDEPIIDAPDRLKTIGSFSDLLTLFLE